MLPSAHYNCVGVLIASFRSSIPSPPIPLFTLRRAPRDTQRKTRGRVDRYSFLVGILPPLLHTGLARRTAMAMLRQLTQRHSFRITNQPLQTCMKALEPRQDALHDLNHGALQLRSIDDWAPRSVGDTTVRFSASMRSSGMQPGMAKRPGARGSMSLRP